MDKPTSIPTERIPEIVEALRNAALLYEDGSCARSNLTSAALLVEWIAAQQPVQEGGGKVPEGHIRFDYTNADGRPDCKIITHDEMRQRYADLREQKNGWPPPPAAGCEEVVAELRELAREWRADINASDLSARADRRNTKPKHFLRDLEAILARQPSSNVITPP